MAFDREDPLKLPGDDKKKPAISMNRLALWLVVGGIGAYLRISGRIGSVAKG